MRRGRPDVGAAPPPWRGEDGLVATPALFAVWLGLLGGIVTIDVGAYLLAASRAQAAADAAALAVVSLDVEPASAPPLQVARSLAARNRAQVERCDCRVGRARAEVTVSVEVGGLVIARTTGHRRISATARAELAAPP